MEESISTEDKIKEAAKKVFQQKGYAATRTRDIAEAADINPALLNYYFRSKEKLFHIIMEESIKDFFFSMAQVLNATDTTLEQKIEQVVSFHMDSLLKNPNLPLFIFGELQNNSISFLKQTSISYGFMKKSYLYTQLCERLKASGNTVDPINFIVNTLVMSIFPFVIKPVLRFAGEMTDEQVTHMLKERVTLVPQWISLMLDSKISK